MIIKTPKKKLAVEITGKLDTYFKSFIYIFDKMLNMYTIRLSSDDNNYLVYFSAPNEADRYIYKSLEDYLYNKTVQSLEKDGIFNNLKELK